MQCALAILSSVTRPAVEYFYTLPLKGCEFWKNCYWKWNVWFDFSIAFETFLIIIRYEWDMIKTYVDLHLICPLFLSDFKENWCFSTAFPKIFKYRLTSRCRRTESIVSLERGCLFMCRIESLFLLQRLKGSMSGDDRDFNNMETRALIKFFFSCKARCRRKFT